MFLSFFESKGHLRLPSFSLIPQNDASLLLINSGMAPMKPWFTGEQEPPRHRVCTCQKCIRTGDIENIGKTARHGTYFEMPGQLLLRRLLQARGIAWSWEFLTSPEWVGLDPDRLYPSVFEGNETHPRRRRGHGHLAGRDRHSGGPHLQVRQGGQLLGARLRPLRPLLRDLLRPAPSGAAASPAAPWAATATAIWRSGTWCSPSSTTTGKTTTLS